MHDSPRSRSIAARTVLATALLASFAAAQRFVVDVRGGGDFRSLQRAVDTVPTGSILEVRGGSHPRVIVREKDLTLVANPRATITAPSAGVGTQPPAVQIEGAGTERVSLANFAIGGNAVGLSWNRLGPAIAVRDIATLRLNRCDVVAPFFTVITGQANGAAALSAVRVRAILLSLCLVRASAAWPKDDVDPRLIPNGAPGIDANQSLVGLSHTSVTGGEVLGYRTRFFIPPTPCPCVSFGGRGGDAVIARELFDDGAGLTPGPGAPIQRYRNGRYQPWGRQPSGRATVVTSRTRQARMVSIGASPTIGTPWQLWVGGDATARALIVGAACREPVVLDDPLLGRALLCLDPRLATKSEILGPEPAAITWPIPAIPTLVGGELAVYVARPGKLSMPIIETIGRPSPR